MFFSSLFEKNKENFVMYNQYASKEQLIKNFTEIVKKNVGKIALPTIVCIGTDRATGDSLGPAVGSILKKNNYPGRVIGTLETPVHAVNLEQILKENNYFQDETVIAIDACLGTSERIGAIALKEGALTPGSGVNKNLPEIGNFHIIGVVNVGGFMEYLVLQNTRLSFVLNMAGIISSSLLAVFSPESTGKGVIHSYTL